MTQSNVRTAAIVVALASISLSLAFIVVVLPARAETSEHCKVTGDYLTSFNCGTSQTFSNGTTLRKFNLVIEEDQTVPITVSNNSLDTIYFPAWTMNGSIPAPTMRMDEGDTVWITVHNLAKNKHHHSLHMHSNHPPEMDGTSGPSGSLAPGTSFTYKFVAGPAGLYPYHCHVSPVQDHINRGLYGAMIIDPKTPRPQAVEYMMLMNGYDLDINPDMIPTAMPPNTAQANQILYPPPVDAQAENEEQAVESGDDAESAAAARPELELERDNEIYTINGKAFEYMQNPIEVKVGQPVRLYLLNMVEFDPMNSFHLHAGMFNYTSSGTEGTPPVVTDIVSLGQGDRGIIDWTPKYTGNNMIHAHINEFTDLGWMGSFQVVE